MPKGTKTIIFGLIGATAISSAAMAGGFSRGTADTDILYEDGGFVMRGGVAYVAPQRGYDTVQVAPGPTMAAGTDGTYTDSYVVPSFAAKFNLTEDARCAGTLTRPFGADATYGPQAILAGIAADAADGSATPSGTAFSNFSTTEYGLTCGYKVDAGPGNFWLIGGAFLQSITYDEGNMIGHPTAGTPASLSLSQDGAVGYRFGAAFEIPQIALRVQGIYRSAVAHELTGTFSVGGAVANPASTGAATMPQSFELKVQSGIAPDWLAFGSVKWTDWSVLQTLDYVTLAPQQKDFFYKDGWTVSTGIGHKFNDMISGSLSLTWDSGVSTTEDVNKDTYTLSTGLAINDGTGGELRLGGGISYLQGGSVAQAASCNGGAGDCGTGTGAKFAYTVGNDWVYAIGGSYKRKF